MLILQDLKKKIYKSPFPASESWCCSVLSCPSRSQREGRVQVSQLLWHLANPRREQHRLRRSPSGSNWIDLNVPFNIAQHDCMDLRGRCCGLELAALRSQEMSPLRNSVPRGGAICHYSFDSYFCFSIIWGFLSLENGILAELKFLILMRSNLTIFFFYGSCFWCWIQLITNPKALSPVLSSRSYSFVFYL